MWLGPLAVLAAGCGSRQSTLSPASRPAADIADLWWGMLIGGTVVFAVVTLLVLVAVLRRRSRPPDERGGLRLVVWGGVVAPVVAIVTLFTFTLRTLPATSAPRGPTALTVEVTGRQWFWDVRYPASGALTANEIHIPVRTRVELVARTDDVIHSFWVPRLNRKIDMIPGKTNRILLRADRPGVYRGQCAEFCGLQHANMAFLVVADPPAVFRAWLAREARPAAVTGGAGERVFEQVGCGACHQIRGTGAQGRVGPDLTHLASRRGLAAETIPNGEGYLGGWILDPQHVKPGNRMPGLDLTGPQLQALLDYLRRLR